MTPRLRLFGAFLGLLAAFLGGWTAQGWRLGAEIDSIEAVAAAELAAAHQRAADRLTTLQGVSDAAVTRSQARPAAVRSAAVAGNGLRLRAAAFAADAASAPAGDCTPAADAAGVLAELLGRVETAGRQAAATADERGDAGAVCEQAWDAMR